MAITEIVINTMNENSGTMWFGIVVCFLFYFYLNLPSKSTQEKNPFTSDCRRPYQGLVHEKTLRDKVLKRGFAKKKIPPKLDAIIIGSGISGMTTAALLAKSGKKVLVLEQHDQAGGCCHTFFEDGFEFDTGVHYVGGMASQTVSKTVFDQITEGQLKWSPMDRNFDTLAFKEAETTKYYHLSNGKGELKQSILDSFPDEEKAIEQFFSELPKIVSAYSFNVILKLIPKRLGRWIVRLRLLNIFTSYPKYAATTTQKYVNSITDNPHLKAVLTYIGFIVGVLPSDSTMLLNAIILNHYSESASYPVGGGSEITMSIIPVIEKHNGRVLVRAKVTDIIVERGRAVGVRVTKGGEHVEIRAETIISACGIPNTLKLLSEDAATATGWPSLFDQGNIKSGVAGLCVFVGLDGTSESLNLPKTNLLAFTSVDWNSACKKFLNQELDLDNLKEFPGLFFSMQSTKDPTWDERFPGKSACSVFTYINYDWFKQWTNEKVKHRGTEYEELKNHLGKLLWSQICKYYPQLEDKVLYMKVGSPVTNNHYIGSTAGEYYGLAQEMGRYQPEISIKLRPKTEIPGLYLTGQDVMGAGVVGALNSAVVTTSSLLKRNIFKDVEKLQRDIVVKEREVTRGKGVINGYSESKTAGY